MKECWVGYRIRPGSAQVTLASVRLGLQSMGGSTVLALFLAFPYSVPMPARRGPYKGTHTMARAYYYASGKNKFLEVQGKRIAVSGMREARKLCKDLNAQPWNF
jgi:hypothetical protein